MPVQTPVNPRFVLAFAVFAAVVGMAICAGAVLAPAPALAVPLVVAISVGCPLFAGWEVPKALVLIRAERTQRAHSGALAAMRKSLEQLPETEHPLGL